MLAVFASTVGAQANLIQNGDFSTSVPSGATGGDWTSQTIDMSGGWRNIGGSHGGIFILNSNGDISTDPTISQTVSGLVVGVQYHVSGEYTSWYLNNYSGGFGVAVDNNWLFTGGPTTIQDWQTFGFDFTATGTSATITLAGERNGTDNDYAIDNINLVQVSGPSSVPDGGSTAAMLCGGFALMGLLRRRALC